MAPTDRRNDGPTNGSAINDRPTHHRTDRLTERQTTTPRFDLQDEVELEGIEVLPLRRAHGLGRALELRLPEQLIHDGVPGTPRRPPRRFMTAHDAHDVTPIFAGWVSERRHTDLQRIGPSWRLLLRRSRFVRSKTLPAVGISRQPTTHPAHWKCKHITPQNRPKRRLETLLRSE